MHVVLFVVFHACGCLTLGNRDEEQTHDTHIFDSYNSRRIMKMYVVFVVCNKVYTIIDGNAFNKMIFNLYFFQIFQCPWRKMRKIKKKHTTKHNFSPVCLGAIRTRVTHTLLCTNIHILSDLHRFSLSTLFSFVSGIKSVYTIWSFLDVYTWPRMDTNMHTWKHWNPESKNKIEKDSRKIFFIRNEVYIVCTKNEAVSAIQFDTIFVRVCVRVCFIWIGTPVFLSLYERVRVCVLCVRFTYCCMSYKQAKRTMPKPKYKMEWNTCDVKRVVKQHRPHISCIERLILSFFFISFHLYLFLGIFFVFPLQSLSLCSFLHMNSEYTRLHNANQTNVSLLFVICSHESYSRSFLVLRPAAFSIFLCRACIWEFLNKSNFYKCGSSLVPEELNI